MLKIIQMVDRFSFNLFVYNINAVISFINGQRKAINTFELNC